MVDVIAFDADDTLWHNEDRYTWAKSRFAELLSAWPEGAAAEHRLEETEVSNIGLYGYGTKSFILSMIETALHLTDGGIAGRDIGQMLDLGRQMLQAEVELFDHVEDTLVDLAADYPLMLITKGDLHEQQRKIDRSGLAAYFRHLEIVGEKSEAVYRRLLQKHQVEPHRFVMVGNSMRSDIVPVLRMGGHAVYIPCHHTWSYEQQVDAPVDWQPAHFELQDIRQLPELIAWLSGCGAAC